MKIFLIFLAALILVGCGSADKPSNVGGPATNPLDYGNGVFYFPVAEAAFANSLAAFIGRHSELEIVAMAGDGTLAYGKDQGYFVVFRHK